MRVFFACLLAFNVLITPIAAIASTYKRPQLSVKQESGVRSQESGAKLAEAEIFAKPLEAAAELGAPAAEPAVPAAVPAPAPLPAAPPVGAVTASLAATLTPGAGGDVDGDTKADPGDTIAYNLTLGNTTGTNATGLSIANPLDSHTTLVPGTLNSTPVAFDQSLTTDEDVNGGTGVNITLQGQDPDGTVAPTFSFRTAAGAVLPSSIATANGTVNSFGSVTCTADGVCSLPAKYTPNANFNGSDSFTFKVNDGTANSNEIGTLSITVNAVNDVPTFTPGGNQTVNEDAGVTSVTNFLTNVRPAQSGNTTEDGQTVQVEIVSNDSPGLFSAGPSFALVGASYPKSFTLNYTPALDQHGVATIKYHVKDNGGTANGGVDTTSPDQTFTITINAVNDIPTVTAKSYNVQANMQISIPPAAGLLVGAADAKDVAGNGSWVPTFKVGTINGVAPVSGIITSTVAGVGTFVANETTGALTIDPAPGVTGTVNTNFTICDNGEGTPSIQCSTTQTLSLVIAGPVIWFVDPTSAAPASETGDGRLSNPFVRLDSANTAITAKQKQRVFVLKGAFPTVANQNISLPGDNTQPTQAQAQDNAIWLIGQGTISTSQSFGVVTTLNGGINNVVTSVVVTDGSSVQAGTFIQIDSEQMYVVSKAGNTLTVTRAIAGTSAASHSTGVNVLLSSSAPFDTFFGLTVPAGTITRPGLTSSASTANNLRPTIQGMVTMKENTIVEGLNLNTTGATKGITASSLSGGVPGSKLIIKDVNVTSAAGNAVDLSATSLTANNQVEYTTSDQTNSPNILTSSTGTALSIVNLTITSNNLNFRSISAGTGAGSAGVGILVSNTGSSGGLKVFGNAGGACTNSTQVGCTGGTIQHKTGADPGGVGLANASTQGIGILLLNTQKASLDRMFLHDFDNFALYGKTVVDVTFTNSTINGANGNNVATDEGCAIFDNLTGTGTFTSDDIRGSIEDQFRVRNTTGTANDIAVTSCTFTGAGVNGDNVNIRSESTATVTTHLTNNTFVTAPSDHIQVTALDSSTMNVIISGTVMSNPGGGAGAGITISGGNAGSTEHMNFNVLNNGTSLVPLTGTKAGGTININEGQGAGTWNGQVKNNFIGDAAIANSGCLACSGILVENHSTSGTLTALVDGNTIKQWGANPAINAQAGDAGNATNTGVLNITVTNNVSSNPGASAQHGFVANIGAGFNGAPFATNVACVDVRSNTLNGNAANAGAGVRTRQREQSTIKIPGYTNTQYNFTAVATLLQANNPASTPAATASTSSAGPGYTNTTPAGSPCQQPTIVTWNLSPFGAQPREYTAENIFADGDTFSPLKVKADLVSMLRDVNLAPSTPSVSPVVAMAQVGENPSATNVSPVAETLLAEAKVGAAASSVTPVDKSNNSLSSFANAIVAMIEPTAHAAEGRGQRSEVSAIKGAGSQESGVGNIGVKSHHARTTNSKLKTENLKLSAAPLMSNSKPATENPILAFAAPFFTPIGQFPVNGTGTGSGFTLPTGKTITVTFKATLNNPPNFASYSATQTVSAQAILTGAFTGNPLLSDDPVPGGTTDPTTTPIDHFNTTSTITGASPGSSTNTGQSVTFSATIAPNTSPDSPAPAGGTLPGGTATFKDGVSDIAGCVGVTVTAGAAQCTTSGLSTGGHSITVNYLGDGNFDPSASGTWIQNVTLSGTSTVVNSSLNPSLVSQNVTFTAEVTSSGITPPTGTVQFHEGATNFGGPVTLTSGGACPANKGCASFSKSDLTSGPAHTITGDYNPDPNFTSSTGSVSQQVNKSNTNVALVSSPGTTVAPGVEVTYTATVTSATVVTGPPDGTVTFKDGASTIACTGGSQTLNGSGVATCKFTYPDDIGSPHDISAVYNGDDSGGRYNGNTSNHVSETVATCSNPYTVTSNADTNTLGTLRYGLTTGVCNGGVINFDNSVTSITLTGELVVGKNVTINGLGSSTLTISGNNIGRVFNISPFNVTITDMTITAGKVTGSNGSTGNPAVGGDGGEALGGAILNGGTLTLNKVIISNSHATGGDGATGTTTGGNGAAARGGAIYNSGTLTLTNSTVNGSNSATGGKGGDSAGTNGNGGSGFGGGIYNAATLTIIESTVAANSGAGGAAGVGGGAAGVAGGSIGGGIYNDGVPSPASLTIWRSTISGNSAGTAGGVYNVGAGTFATLLIGNSTISGNHADNDGGGIYNDGATGTTTIQNTTISNNTADFDDTLGGVGGGLKIATGTLFLQSTIVAKNFKGTSTPAADDINGTVAGAGASSFNLVGVDTGLTGITNVDGFNNQVGTAGTPIDPLLSALANNGGPTQTHALANGSSAVDAGKNFSVTKLNGAIDNVVTSVVVADASSIPSSGVTIRIETEQMLVTGKTGNTLTVTRGVNTTTAASHADTTDVFLLVDQRVFVRPIDFIAGAGPGDESDIGAFELQVPSPTISKAFDTPSIQSGGTSGVTLTLTNPNTFDLTNASFTDTLVNMTAVGGTVGGSCVGANSNSFAVGQTALSFSGITIPANSVPCTVTFNVTSSTPGALPNTTSGVTTTQTPTAGNPSNTAILTVAGAPTIAKAFSPTSINPGGSSTVTLTLSNTNAFPLTSATFSDTLTNMSALGGNVTGTCGASPATLNPGDTALTFTGITIPASGSCTVIFDVTSNTQGVHPNSTSGVSSAETPVAGAVSNTANLAVGTNNITKQFTPTTIQSGGTSQVTLTLTSASATPQTNAFFSDTLVNMSAVGGTVGGTCAGANSNTFAAGQTALNFTGITIPANNVPCTLLFNVTSSSPGVNPNSTGGITTDQTPIGGGSNSVDLTVLAAPTISKGFAPDKIQTGGSSTVTITVSNSNSVQLTGGAFTDNLVNMSAVGGSVTGTCAASPNSLSANQTALSFTGITIPATGSCTVIFDVKSSTPGTNPNSTSGVTTNETPVAGTASAPANLLVFDPPLVQSITRVNASPTSAATVDFLVTFTKNVTGVNIGVNSDFTLTTGGGISGASITGLSGSNNIYTVTVNTGTGDGTISLNVIDDDSIVSTDALPLPLGGSGAGNGTFTTGQVYTVDRFDPTVTSITRVGSSPTNATSVDFLVTFSEPVSGVDSTDFALTTAGVVGPSVGTVTGSGATRTVTVNTGTGDGTIRLDLVDDDTILDNASKPLGGVGAGNGNFTAGEVYTIDKSPPTVTVEQAISQIDPVTGPASTTIIHFTATFSESVTGLTSAGVTVFGTAGATVVNVTGSGTTYDLAVQGMTQTGTVRASINASAATDTAGNGNAASTSADNTVQFNKDDFTTFEVNSTADPGDGSCDPIGIGDGCTLREAINAANADAGAETITFNSTVFAAPGPYTINLTGVLSDITTDMTISGPGAKVLTVRRNTGGNYRVFHITGGNVTIDALTISNGNVPTDVGGGIFAAGVGTVTISNSAISGNSGQVGGGIHAAAGVVNIVNCAITGNQGQGGGGVSTFFNATNITNTTISGNAAFDNAGGILASGGPTLTITGSTITDNRADNNNDTFGVGGGIGRFGGTVILRSSIVAANYSKPSPSTTPDDINGAMDSSSSYNLIGTGGSGGLVDVSGDAVHQNLVGVASPGLNPLADNGGPTMTHSLQCVSPAIDKGKAFGLTTDQRGGPRPFDFADSVYPNATGGDGSDIGAFEAQGAGGCLPTAVPPGSPTTTNEDTPVTITLTGTYSQPNTPLTFTITQQPAHAAALTPSAANCPPGGLSQTCTATVTYSPNLNFNGGDLFKFKVSAGVGLDSDPADVPVTVDAVNDPPTLALAGNQVILANQGPQTVTPFAISSAGPPDEAGQTVQYIVTNNTNPGLFSAAPAIDTSGTLTYTSAANTSGVATITVVAQDNGGGTDTSAPQSFTITVNQSATTTTLGSSPNPSFTNQVVTFTATVTSNTAVVGPPTGTVQFFDGVNPITCSNGNTSTQTLDGAGVATCQTSSLSSAGSPHSISGLYSGDGAYTGSTSNTVSQTVKAPLTLVVNDTGDNPDVSLDGICADVNGNCTLRAAIQEANFAASDDTINFNLPANSTINLLTALPAIDGNVTINGPGANTLTVQRSTAGGTPDFGVFAINTGRVVTINGLTISNGRNVGGPGGGIFNDSGTLTVNNCTISGNNGPSGGGIATNQKTGGGDATLTINNSTISGNTASFGGGIYNSPANGKTTTLTISNSTISGNFTSGNAGAILNDAIPGSASVITITNVTVSGNSASSGSGGIQNSALGGTATIKLANTIVAGNLLGATPSDIVVTVDPTSSFNLVGVDTGITGISNGSNGNQIGTAASPLNPRLSPLAFNGGTTQTMALLSGSPALDAGSNTIATNAGLTTDQRGAGFNRFIDGVDADAIAQVDIGAFEAQPSIEDITDKTTNEDIALPSFNFAVADAGVSNFTVTATSSNPTLVPNGNINVGGAGSTRSLSITPALNENGTTTITVTAAGTIGTTPVSMSDTFLLTVNAVNDAPTFNLNAGPAVNEDSGPQSIASQAVNISAGPANESGQTLAFTVINNNNGLFSVQPTISPTGTLTFTSAPDANGSAIVSVALKDNGGTANGGQDTSATQQFTITVNAVNDAPVNTVPGAQQVNENNNLTFSLANGNKVSIADIDDGGGLMRETLTATNGTITLGGTIGLVFTVGDGVQDPTMTFTGTVSNINVALQGMQFIPNNGFSGAATLTVLTNDQGNTGSGGALSDTDVVNITVNDGGTLQLSAATYTVGENSGPAVITITRTGASAGTATVKIDTSNGTATAGSDYTAVSQTVTFNNGETSKTVNIPITDDLLNEPDETVNITLSNVGGSGALGTPATAVLTITNDDPVGGYIKFSAANYNVNEGGVATITVQRSGTLTQAVTIDFATSDNSDPASFVPCAPTPGNTLATSRCDFETALGRISFAAGDGADKTFTVMTQQDNYVEGPETLTLTLSNATGGASILGLPTATLTIADDVSEPATNPVDDSGNFVESLYRDFLNRPSDPAGKAFWVNNIDKCNDPAQRPPNLTQAQCIAAFRVSTAQAFFLSGEFQNTGGTAYLTNKVAFGGLPTFIRFEKDAQMIGKGYVFGAPGADAVLEANKVAYFNDYVSRTEFVNTYGPVSNQQYVETLTQNTGVQWGVGEKQQLVDGLNNATETRATVLRKITEKPEFRTAEREPMFVLAEYFGFLRRNPDQAGFNFWLTKLHNANGNAMQAEMVRAFVESPEYRGRFGQ